MHALGILQQRLRDGCSGMHLKRLQALIACVAAALHVQRITISELGRALASPAQPKHSIKRVDRLAANRHLQRERSSIYGAIARWLLSGNVRPIIVIDWSDLSADRRWQLLRAAVPMGGRTLTLYEEVHPLRRLASPRVHRAFLRQLKALLPEAAVPVVVTDAGFRTPWFRSVSRLGWDWIGRVRNRDCVRSQHSDTWIAAKSLYARARAIPQSLGPHELARSNATACRLFLVKQPSRHRVAKGARGQPKRSAESRARARMNREPWLLAGSPTLQLSAREAVNIYAQRMQIEEAFRDLKCTRYGLGFELHLSRDKARLATLLLIGSLALLLLWLIGTAARECGLHRHYQSNTRTARPVLSVFNLACLLVRHAYYASPPRLLMPFMYHRQIAPSITL
jgi:hypothetical protein